MGVCRSTPETFYYRLVITRVPTLKRPPGLSRGSSALAASVLHPDPRPDA